MAKFYLAIFSIIITLFSSAQTTVTFTPSKDNTIYTPATSNSDGLGGYFYAGVTDNGGLRRGLIRFDLSSIPAGSVITAATLTLNMVKTRGGNIAVNLHRLSQDWGEGSSNAGASVDGGGAGAPATANDATWINRFHPATAWTTVGGIFTAGVSATTGVGAVGSYTWSGAQMIADLQAWVNSAATNFGWMIKTNETGSRNAKKFSSRNNANVSQRPSLSVTFTPALPVTLAFLKAAEVKEGVLVSWQTQTEFNNAFFLVEHSINGTSFSSIGKITGAGSTNSPKNYSFIHQALSQGNHYYRLAQTDINGQVNYSAVVQVAVRSKHKQLNISPNPVIDLITLRGVRLNENLSYSIVNASGAIVSSGKLQSSQINASNLPGGYYTIMLRDSNEAYFGKFLKR